MVLFNEAYQSIFNASSSFNDMQFRHCFFMGEEDYLFIPPIEEVVRRSEAFEFIKIKTVGHVCNIDQPEIFNQAFN